jgi:hypothetical protein
MYVVMSMNSTSRLISGAALNCGLVAAALLAVALITAAAGPAAAQEFKQTGSFGSWETYSGAEKKAAVCYMGSEPRKAKGKYKRRGQTLVVITHRPAEKSVNVVNIQAGYTYLKDSPVQLTIDGAVYEMFTDGGNAWAADAKSDAALVRAMRAGSTLIVQGMSSRGTVTTDTYSLSGFSKAHNTMNRACKVK